MEANAGGGGRMIKRLRIIPGRWHHFLTLPIVLDESPLAPDSGAVLFDRRRRPAGSSLSISISGAISSLRSLDPFRLGLIKRQKNWQTRPNLLASGE